MYQFLIPNRKVFYNIKIAISKYVLTIGLNTSIENK